MARSATSPELALFRSPGQWSRIRAAIFQPSTVYTARVNQTFSSLDKLLEITYDTGSGTLADALPDMTLFVGSGAGLWDKGIARLRSIDGSKMYIGETSDLQVSDNDYLTVVNDFGLWARPILISEGVPYIDGGEAYSDQHTAWTPVPRMGPTRVLKKTGATVSASFDFSGSFAQGSSISVYSTSAPGSSAISGGSTATPSITWNSIGWKMVYLTLTAANGKQAFGVRYVYIWEEENAPEPILLNGLRGSVDAGGWEASITLFDEASLELVREHARVVLFSEDFFGPYDASTESEIGPVSGAENILFDGWIARESIVWDLEAGSVSFTAYTANFFLSRIPAWPYGVEFTASTPAAWTQIQNLTVDLALLDFFLHATTAPKVIDLFLTGDTRLAAELGSLSSNLWAQINEMAFDTIYARALVNCLNQLYVEIHPQLVPSGSRSWPTVLTFTKEDFERPIDLERITLEELSLLDLSGVYINSSGSAEAFFSLAPGHSYSHYGEAEVQPKRLLSSQSQANTLAGLYRSWRNNRYKTIPLRLSGNNRLVDIAPRQKCYITLSPADTKRGISYAGNIIPLSVDRSQDLETGFLRTEIVFEGETVEGRAENGDIPGSVNISFPPLKPLPALPPLGVLLPSTGLPVVTGSRVILHDYGSAQNGVGIVYTSNFDSTSPTWITINSGLTLDQARAVNQIEVTPSGAVYAGYMPNTNPGSDYFLARAPFPGGTFVIQTLPGRLYGFAVNPLEEEQILFWAAEAGSRRFYLGANNSYSAGVFQDNFASGGGGVGSLSFGDNYWLVTANNGFRRLNASGSAVVGSGSPSILHWHIRVGSTGFTFHDYNGSDAVLRGDNNLTSNAVVSTGQQVSIREGDVDPTGLYLMARGLGAYKARSSDGGVTWTTIPSLPAGIWNYRNGGTAGRWIAAGGTAVRYTEDFGGSWALKGGNLGSLNPIYNIDVIRFVP
jgi:hypothetical protein